MPGVTAPINAKLAQVPTVDIDGQGTFKYILCKIYEGNNMQDFKLIVRGKAAALFHSDIYDRLDASLEAEGINCECVGGGKIKHNPDEHSIEVFGKSQAYGKANHATTASLLEESFEAYSITWSD
ncbi:14 kDa phosphohistidine phosphatase-like [Babylonia areolata]|uniref:14 kDa phosphohistidine phosphatase-like n=1 Tax=Babylonia areolata TaxID=304850 RepID=UPI003FD1685C